MCDRSRWKRRSYCYSTKKIKSIATSRWERQIPKEENYWNQFCQEQKTKLIVRNSYPNLTHFPRFHKYPLSLNHEFSTNNDVKNSDDYINQFIREKKPTAKSKFNIPSITLESFSRENNTDSFGEPTIPTITVFSSTPSEPPTKICSTSEREFVKVITENIFGTESSSQFCRNNQNFVSEDIRNRKIYSRRNCPFHRNEPPTRIFDDDIERYLVDSNRIEETNVDKEIIEKNGKLLAKKTCKMCQETINKCTSKSIANLMDDIKLPDDLNSNQGNSTFISQTSKLNDVTNECISKLTENHFDDIKLSDDSNQRISTRMLQIPKLNDADLKLNSSKFIIKNVDDTHVTLDSQTLIQDKNWLTVPKLPETKRRPMSKTKSETLTAKLPKCIKKRKESSVDNNFQKYCTKYAYQALKYVTPNKKLCFDPATYETTNKISPSEEKLCENREKRCVNVSTSLRSLISLDHELGDHFQDYSRSSKNFLNKLPILSYFPRKNHDRCLPCLYQSVEKIVESREKNTYKMTKRRTPMQNVSIDSDSSDVTLPEFKDNENQIDNYVKITECDIVTDKIECDLPETTKIKEDAPELNKKVLIDEVKETKKSPIDLKLGSENLKENKIESKSIPMLAKKSKISSSYSSSDEDKSISVLPEDNSKKSKCRAPCHAPTILCHSLEPLKALKMRKSTSLQARIALDEATIEDSKNVTSATLETKQQERFASKDSKKETESVPAKKILTKVKSVSENLMAESGHMSKEKIGVLRRGSSCVNLETILRNFAKDSNLDSLVEDDSEKSLEEIFLFSPEEIEKVLKDLEQQNSSTINILSTLCDMFLNRVLESNNTDKKRSKIIRNLTKLLVESRGYLNPNKFPSDLIFSSSKSVPTQRPFLNAERLRNILPLDSYNLIAPLLAMPEYYPRMPFALHGRQNPIALVRKQRSDKSDSSQETGDDLIVHPPSEMVDTILHDEVEANRSNPYALFLKKERRKVVTWRPLQEEDLKGYDPEATLRMRADKVTMKICKDFCKWLRSLGGAERDIDETVLKDMFEISFSADACKATQISVKEMATVPTDVASARLCHGSSVLAMTRKQLHRDAEAESTPKRAVAFGTSMPTDLLFLPPNNRVRQKWLECKNVPHDLETMDTVWNGITNLDSVQGFLKWISNYPEVSPPEILTKPTHRKMKSTKSTEKKEEGLEDLKKRGKKRATSRATSNNTDRIDLRSVV